MSVVGDNIKRRRETLGLSQVDLAEAIGETKQTIWKYESGTVTNIPLPKVEAIARALSCSPNELAGWSVPEDPVLKKQRDEINEVFDRLPPDLRTQVLTFLRGIAQREQSQDSRSESD